MYISGYLEVFKYLLITMHIALVPMFMFVLPCRKSAFFVLTLQKLSNMMLQRFKVHQIAMFVWEGP